MTNPLLTEAIDALTRGTDLGSSQTGAILDEIMAGRVSEVQISAFLVGLRCKGETVDELIGLARTMRRLAEPVQVSRGPLVDTAGTGGGTPTFNISTTAALIAAGAGCVTAKHGNRSATSSSGSADLLEALGVRIDIDSEDVGRCLERTGFGFMFAPRHHLATRHVVPVRKALGVGTIFNYLGPLTNPAGASRQVVGVSDPSFQETVARALAGLGTEEAMVVSSADGLDELSVGAESTVIHVRGGELTTFTVTPEEVGLQRSAADALRGGEPADNAAITTAVLAGERGPHRDVALFNAAAAATVGGLASGLAEGVDIAAEAVDSGAAQRVLDHLRIVTIELATAE
ncbi:MAG: anthranilate phosphoribosyltransferase [Solirubrobacterales bacterium]